MQRYEIIFFFVIYSDDYLWGEKEKEALWKYFRRKIRNLLKN